MRRPRGRLGVGASGGVGGLTTRRLDNRLERCQTLRRGADLGLQVVAVALHRGDGRGRLGQGGRRQLTLAGTVLQLGDALSRLSHAGTGGLRRSSGVGQLGGEPDATAFRVGQLSRERPNARLRLGEGGGHLLALFARGGQHSPPGLELTTEGVGLGVRKLEIVAQRVALLQRECVGLDGGGERGLQLAGLAGEGLPGGLDVVGDGGARLGRGPGLLGRGDLLFRPRASHLGVGHAIRRLAGELLGGRRTRTGLGGFRLGGGDAALGLSRARVELGRAGGVARGDLPELGLVGVRGLEVVLERRGGALGVEGASRGACGRVLQLDGAAAAAELLAIAETQAAEAASS